MRRPPHSCSDRSDPFLPPPSAVQLTHSERNTLVSAAREALDADPALAKIPLIVGTGASSTRETIELTREAAERGADFAMVIAPGAFSFLPFFQ